MGPYFLFRHPPLEWDNGRALGRPTGSGAKEPAGRPHTGRRTIVLRDSYTRLRHGFESDALAIAHQRSFFRVDFIPGGVLSVGRVGGPDIPEFEAA